MCRENIAMDKKVPHREIDDTVILKFEPVESTDEEADDEPQEVFHYEEECDEEEDTTVSTKPVESSEEEQEQKQDEEDDKEELEESQKISDPEEWDEEEDTMVTMKHLESSEEEQDEEEKEEESPEICDYEECDEGDYMAVTMKPVESSEEEQEQKQDEEEEEDDKEELEESQKIFDPEEWDEEEDTTVTMKHVESSEEEQDEEEEELEECDEDKCMVVTVKAPKTNPASPQTRQKKATTQRKKNKCPICFVEVWNVAKHLRSSMHALPKAVSQRWRYLDTPTVRKKMPCPLDRCHITTTNVGQHLQKFHDLQRGTLSYAKLMMHSQKARTMYSKMLTSIQLKTTEPDVALPLEVVNKEIWLEYNAYLKNHLGKSIQSRRTAVLRPIKALQSVNRHARLRVIFSQPVDDEDTAANKLENNFLLPLLQEARKAPRTASNAVNKVRDLERFPQYLIDRKGLFLRQKNIREEEITRVLSVLRNHWKKEKLGKLRHQRNVQQRQTSTENTMDLSDISLPQLRTALKNAIATNPLKARNDCICLLMLTNFSRVGEVANMTLTEVKEAKEVSPGYFSVEVANHKTASSMGKAPVMLSAQDLTLLRQYIKKCRRRIAPTANMAEEVFITSSGATLTPSHLNKIVNTGLGGSASRIRKSLAGRYMYEDTKFKKALSAKMQHTEATHSQWYEGKARREEMLTVVRRINEDFSTNRTPSATVTSATVTSAEGVQPAQEAPAPSTMDAPSSTPTTTKVTSSTPKQGFCLASLLRGKPFQRQRAPSSREGPQATVTPRDVEVPPPDSLQSDSSQSPPDSPHSPPDSPHSPPQQVCTPMHHQVDMTLVSDVPKEIRDWYKPATTRLIMDDIPSGTRVKWTLDEHAAIHKFFGSYRGQIVNIRECVRTILRVYPECSRRLKRRTPLQIRDKIRSFVRKY